MDSSSYWTRSVVPFSLGLDCTRRAGTPARRFRRPRRFTGRLAAPAELVPDSADLYMGADLLNRFFSSWADDVQGKSPLEAARNVIVTYLTGSGLKVWTPLCYLGW